MAKQDAKDTLSIKVSHADMLAYTDQVYNDMDDPAINGIATHALDESPHNLPARFLNVQNQIDAINDELATKIDNGSIDLTGKADVIGDTFTGTVVFNHSDEAIVIDGAPLTDRAIRGKSNGVNRWEIALGSNDAETGANAGSDLVVVRYRDDGLYLGSPMSIARKDGKVRITNLVVTGTYSGPGGGTGGGTGNALPTFTVIGLLATGEGTLRWYNDSAGEMIIYGIRGSVGTAPVGSAVTFAMRVDGVVQGTYSIPANAITSGLIPVTIVIPMGSYVTIDITAIGSTYAGATLIVQMTPTEI